MKILILGGAGFLGANLVRRCLTEPNAEITVVDALDPISKSTTENLQELLSKITFIQGDIRDEKLLAEIIPGKDVIFNCAAQTSHPISIQNPVLDAEINCIGNLKILEAIKKWNPAAVVIYTSTSTVIGKTINPVITEEHSEHPLEIYSANKGVAEKYYEIYHNVHGLNTVILRFANLFGPYGKNFPEFGFMNYFLHLAATNQDIKVYGEGSQLRNVMFVDDATEILLQAAKSPKLFGTMHFATSEFHYTLAEIAAAIVDAFQSGRVTQIPWPADRLKIEVGAVKFSSAALTQLTGWKARYSMAEGLRKTVEILKLEKRVKA